MAPPKLYESPHIQLGQLFLVARRAGRDFEEWWREAVRPGMPLVMTNSPAWVEGCIRWPTDRNDRLTWQAAINQSKEGWRRAFYRETPAREEEALRFLADAIGALVEAAEDAAGAEEDELRELMAA